MVELDPSTKVRLRPLYRVFGNSKVLCDGARVSFSPESQGTIPPARDAAKDQGVKYYASSVAMSDTVPLLYQSEFFNWQRYQLLQGI